MTYTICFTDRERLESVHLTRKNNLEASSLGMYDSVCCETSHCIYPSQLIQQKMKLKRMLVRNKVNCKGRKRSINTLWPKIKKREKKRTKQKQPCLNALLFLT